MPNLLVRPAPVPSIAKAAGNALAMRSTQENISGAQTRNALAKKQLGSYDADQKMKEDQIHYQTQARAISTALQAPDSEQASNIFKSLGGDENANIQFEGDSVIMDYETHTIKGPRSIMSEMFTKIGEDPAWAKDPKTWSWFSSNGGSIINKKVEQTPEGKLADQKELAKYKAGLKKNEDGTVKKEAALKRISNIQKSIATLEKTDMITAMLAKENPELAQMIGQKIDPELKASLMSAWDNELDYLEQFSGTSRKKKPVQPESGSGVTHTFVPGKGLVPVGKK